MAWTAPRTWVANEVLTAALLNTHLRDNMTYLGATHAHAGAAGDGADIAATQANQETATSITTYITPGRQQYHPSAAKGWVVFTVGAGGTPSIVASYNVASITDSAAGVFIVNWATDFSSANYAYAISHEPTISTDYLIAYVGAGGQAAGTLQILVKKHDGSAYVDPGVLSVIAFGDQ